jgi:hypothetical protein
MVQVVIEITEKQFDLMKLIARTQHYRGDLTIEQAIAHGTVLPEGHGDLIDVNELNEFALNHDISGSAFDGELIYNAGETDRGDIIYEPVIDKLNVIVEADKR